MQISDVVQHAKKCRQRGEYAGVLNDWMLPTNAVVAGSKDSFKATIFSSAMLVAWLFRNIRQYRLWKGGVNHASLACLALYAVLTKTMCGCDLFATEPGIRIGNVVLVIQILHRFGRLHEPRTPSRGNRGG